MGRAPDRGRPAMMTTFIFRVRNVPAALYKAMGGFATNGVNMTKLESYQLGGKFIATLFYADIEGHPDDPSVKHALEELRFFSKEVRILGVYPRSEFARGMERRGLTAPRRNQTLIEPGRADRLAAVGLVVDLEERLDLRDPAVAHEGDVVRMVVVAGIGGLVGELHGEAEAVVVLRADLLQPLEFLDAGNGGEDQRVLEEGRFGWRTGRMLQAENDGVSDHLDYLSVGTGAQSLSAQARMRWWAIAAFGGTKMPSDVSPGEHGADLVAGEPAAVLELGPVEADVLVERLAEAADHQRIAGTARAGWRGRRRGRAGCRIPPASRGAPRPRSSRRAR